MHINYPMCAHQKNINVEIYVIVWHVRCAQRLTFAIEANAHKFSIRTLDYICWCLMLIKSDRHVNFEMDKLDRRVCSVKVPHRQLPYPFTLNANFFRCCCCCCCWCWCTVSVQKCDLLTTADISLHITSHSTTHIIFMRSINQNFRMDHEFSILESDSTVFSRYFFRHPLSINRIIL